MCIAQCETPLQADAFGRAVCGLSLAGTVDSKPAGGVDVCLL